MPEDCTTIAGASGVWTRALPFLRARLPFEDFQTWFSDVCVVDVNDGTVVLGVPSLYRKDWIEREFQTDLEAVFSELYQKTVGVECTVTEGMETVSANSGQEAPVIETSVSVSRSLPDGFQLNEKYTFDSFVIGGCNKMTHAAAKAVALTPAESYNPLFIYGDVGLGKTHLLHAIGNHVHAHTPQLKVGFISAEQFVNEFIDAIRRNDRHSFQRKYRRVDVLLIDDIHVLAGKGATQEEFFHTFNALHNAHKQIVIASDRPPKNIPTIEDRLRSRFEWGLITDIAVPDYETRLAILRQKCESTQFDLPDEILQLIARRIDSSIREMEGALMRLNFEAGRSAMTEKEASRILSEVFRRPERDISIDKIQKRVADHFRIRTGDILGTNRSRSIALPRQIAMYLCRHLTNHSYPEIGTFFGKKDHTTVIFAHKKITTLIEEDEELRNVVQSISTSLQ